MLLSPFLQGILTMLKTEKRNTKDSPSENNVRDGKEKRKDSLSEGRFNHQSFD